MLRTLNSTLRKMPLIEDNLESVRKKLARALVGRTVDLLAGGKTIVHGIVTGVFPAAGSAKIIVNNRLYDMDQVLTATTNATH